MTITTTTLRAQYNGNGVTTSFSVPFEFLEGSTVKVILTSVAGVDTVKTLTTHYTVTGGGTVQPATGSVVMITAPATGEKLTILRAQPLTQAASYTEGDAFPAKTHEKALDRQDMQVQMLAERVNRALKLKETSAHSDMTFPEPEADKIVGWNTDGDELENKTVAALDGVEIIDEDDMASDSATKVPTQQSVKAYSDTKIAAAATDASGFGFVLDEDDMASDSATKVPTQQSVKAYADTKLSAADPFDQTATGDFWADEGSPRIHRMTDRVFIGDAVDSSGNHADSGLSWLDDYAIGYLDISASVMVLSPVGGTAVVGASRASDNAGPPTGPAIIGVSGVGIGDGALSKTVWGGYFEGQKRTGYSGGVCGVEIEVMNESDALVSVNPYNAAAGSTHAATFGSGAGQAGMEDASAAIGLITTGSRFEKGIVFYNTTLIRATPGDETTAAVAMQFARGHQQEWIYNFAGERSAFVRSDGSNSTLQTGIVFNNSGFEVRGMRSDGVTENTFFQVFASSFATGADFVQVIPVATSGSGPTIGAAGPNTDAPLQLAAKGSSAVTMKNGNGLVAQFSVAASGANRFNFTGSIASSPITIGALGSDTNIDILFSPKGSGVLRFGTWTSNADAAVNGYITVKDAAGNTRKLATIA